MGLRLGQPLKVRAFHWTRSLLLAGRVQRGANLRATICAVTCYLPGVRRSSVGGFGHRVSPRLKLLKSRISGSTVRSGISTAVGDEGA